MCVRVRARACCALACACCVWQGDDDADIEADFEAWRAKFWAAARKKFMGVDADDEKGESVRAGCACRASEGVARAALACLLVCVLVCLFASLLACLLGAPLRSALLLFDRSGE